MPIKVRLAEVMLDRGVTLTELSVSVGVTMANLSNLKRGHVKAVRFSTLEAICRHLKCQPGEVLEFSRGTDL
nr:helix-turn-helix transcriptional regulator [Hyphomonas sp. Mor2]